jgi:hypothetical protein
MDIIKFYGFVAVVVAVLAGLIFLAAKCAHRVCKHHRWPRIAALSIALVYFFVLVAPFAVFGSSWITFWSYLAIPFSLLLEIVVPISFVVYTATTSIIAASFWGTFPYCVCAIVLLIRRKWDTLQVKNSAA